MKMTGIMSLPIVMVIFEVTKLDLRHRKIATVIAGCEDFSVVLQDMSAVINVKEGDTLHLLCIPTKDLRGAEVVLGVSIKKKEEGYLRPLYNSDEFFAKLFDKFALSSS